MIEISERHGSDRGELEACATDSPRGEFRVHRWHRRLPMVLAAGPGSASRQAIGTGVFFGMIAAVAIGILLVPFFFVYIYRLKGKFSQKVKRS